MPDTPLVPDRAFAELLLGRGMPATLLTSAGQLPVILVPFPSADGAYAEDLLMAFGGLIGAEPQAWGDEDSVRLWIGVGRGVTLAVRLVHAVLADQAYDIDPDLAHAWEALHRFTVAASTHPDPAGRRPREAFLEMRRQASKLERFMLRAVPVYTTFTDSLLGMVSAAIEDGTLADDLALPNREDLERPVADEARRRLAAHLAADAAGLPLEEADLPEEDDPAEEFIEIPVGETFQVAPMPPEELAEAIAAHHTIATMSPEEQERRVRREIGPQAFDAQSLVSHLPHDELLFMFWTTKRWGALPRHDSGDRAARVQEAINVLGFIRDSGLRPAEMLEPTNVDPTVLAALAQAAMIRRIEARDPSPTAAGPLAPFSGLTPIVEYDFDDLNARFASPPPDHP